MTKHLALFASLGRLTSSLHMMSVGTFWMGEAAMFCASCSLSFLPEETQRRSLHKWHRCALSSLKGCTVCPKADPSA